MAHTRLQSAPKGAILRAYQGKETMNEQLDAATLALLADLEAGLSADLDWEADDELDELAD